MFHKLSDRRTTNTQHERNLAFTSKTVLLNDEKCVFMNFLAISSDSPNDTSHRRFMTSYCIGFAVD
jgi:hypothetical protein